MMRIISSVMSLMMGMFAGIALVVSCGDDSPSRADAATCDCPAAEPPISGRIMIVNGMQTIAANSRGGQGVACPDGAKIISGSCTTNIASPVRDVTLEQSGFYEAEQGWNCEFKNNESTPVTIKVSALCLVPAS